MYSLTDLMDSVFFPLSDKIFFEDYDDGKIQRMMCYTKDSTKVSFYTRQSYLKAILSKDIYDEISNYERIKHDDNTTTLLQKFCDAAEGKQVRSAKPLINKAAVISDSFFESEFQRIKSLICVSSYAQCIENSEKCTLDSIKQIVDDSSFSANRNYFTTEISKKLSNSIWPYIKKECGITEDIDPDKIDAFLTCTIIFIIFDNKYYEKQRWINDEKKNTIKCNIKKFLEIKLYNGFSPKNNEDVIKKYDALLVKKLYKAELRDIKGTIEEIISKIYVFPRFKAITPSLATPVSGDCFKSLIIGDSGLGKSLFSSLIVLTLSIEQLVNEDVESINCNEWDELVLFAKECKKKLQLKNYQPVIIESKKLNNIEDFSEVKNILLENCLGLDKCDASIKNILLSRKLLFIIDGIDEMRHDKRRDFCENLTSFSAEDNNCSVLVTSRKIPLANMRGFSEWELCEMDDTQVKEFIDKIGSRYEGFFASLNKEWTKNIVLKNKYLSAICKNPYFLIHTLLSLREQRDKQISIAKIYDSITYSLIDSRMKSQEISDYHVQEALYKISWEMLVQKNEEWSLNLGEAEKIIEKSMNESDREAFTNNIRGFIDLLSHNSGLLAYKESGYAFLHNMFFCYYVANELASRIKNLAEKLGYKRSERNFEFSGRHISDIGETLDCLAERLDEEEAKTILTMVFAPLKGSNQALCLLIEWLLYKSATVENDVEVNNIAKIFKDFMEGKFEKMELNDNIKGKVEKLLARVIQKNTYGGDEKNE